MFEPGTCLELKENVPGDPIDCATTHSVEIVGNINLATAYPTEFASLDAQKTKLAELCGLAVKEYSGGTDIAAKGLIITWDTLQEQSWAAGSRRVNCKVGALLPDGTGLAPVTGTVRAQTIPQTPPPTTTTPS